MRIVVATVAASLVVMPVMADEISFGGITIGVSDCAETLDMIQAEGFGDATMFSNFTGGRAASLFRGAFDMDFVVGGAVHCDENNDSVAGIGVQIPKHRANELADALDRRYRRRSRRLPNLGAGEARYASESGQTQARLHYVHVSFDAFLDMGTADFNAQMQRYAAEKENQRRRSVDGAFD